MPGNPRDMITSAERCFPVRIRISVPPSGLGQRHTQITAWLDENCGADGWAMTPSGTRGVLNDALSIYFADAALANAFSPGGAPAPGWKLPEASSRCERMSPCPGSVRRCIGRPKLVGRHPRVWRCFSEVRSRERLKSVESECGAVAVGRTYLLPPLSSDGASLVRPWLRFHTPLIEPDVQISRIRLSDKTSRLFACNAVCSG